MKPTKHYQQKAFSGGGLGVFLALALALFLAGPAPAVAAEQIQIRLQSEKVFATHAHIEVEVGPTELLPLEWREEYATSPSGPWIPAGAGASEGSEFSPELNGYANTVLIALAETSHPSHSSALLHHLTPDTTYYARFHAKTENGEAEKTLEFTTTGIAKPAIFSAAENDVSAVESISQLESTPTSAGFAALIETNGAEAEYRLEYSTSESGPWSPACAGSITLAEDFTNLECHLSALTPETRYYARLQASSERGSTEVISPFTTPTAKPVVSQPQVRNVTATSAHLSATVEPNGSETDWRFESAGFEAGPWAPIPAAAGSISVAEANAGALRVEATFNGLTPSTDYYIRLFAENEAGEGVSCRRVPEHLRELVCEPISTATDDISSFHTSGLPSAETLATHALHGESLRLLGAVNPRSVPTSEEQAITIAGAPSGGTFTLAFKGHATEPIAFDASAEKVSSALQALPGIGTGSPGVASISVSGDLGGPYVVYFGGENGPLAETDQPPIGTDASGLIPSGMVTATTLQQGGESYEARYHFEYVSQLQFEQPGAEGGWAKAVASPEVDIGAGDAPHFAGYDLPALVPGETYRYRIDALNEVGDALGAEQTLTIPAPITAPEQGPCANEALRVGSSAKLSACRAYEQLTPVNKEGAQEIFHFSSSGVGTNVVIGEGGNHFAFENPTVSLGSGPDAGQSPYFFSRAPGLGWQLTAGAAQPETGVNLINPLIFSPELTQFGFDSRFEAGAESQSPSVKYKAGPPGGPYVTVASVPRKQAQSGWVAASADFSNLVLEVEDHTLLSKKSTGTVHGADLYEYSEGALHQTNVEAGKTIGTCGASIVHATDQAGGSSIHAVSEDGSSVFFEAIPSGQGCSEPKHLYMRLNGESTIDFGAFRLLAADPTGSRLLLEAVRGETHEFVLYDVESALAKPLFTTTGQLIEPVISKDLSSLYFGSHEVLAGTEAPALSPETGHISNVENIYRYDIAGEALDFVVQAEITDVSTPQLSADGRAFYFVARRVAGLPGGAVVLRGGRDTTADEENPEFRPTKQIYRYDELEGLIQCMSCASSFDPEPALWSTFGGEPSKTRDGQPATNFISSDGTRAFFETPAALLPTDVDGEIEPEEKGGEFSNQRDSSPSSDTYEWRLAGIDGCARLQGCLALITSGRGGHLNLLLGAGSDGKDVFFFSHSQLVPADQDTAGDIYDARVGGGFAPPTPRPVECEGDACHHPAAPPVEPTLSTSISSGSGNPPRPSKVHRQKKKHHVRHGHPRHRGGVRRGVAR